MLVSSWQREQRWRGKSFCTPFNKTPLSSPFYPVGEGNKICKQTEKDIVQVISEFISRWLGTALPQLFLLFLGILLVILVVTALWERKIKKMGGIFGVLIGLFMAALALEENIASFIGNMEFQTRVRLIAILLSLSLLVLTLVAWRKRGLQRRYGLTWTSVSLIVLLTALFPGPLRSFPSLLGMHYGVAVAALFIVFLLLLVFHLSVALSDLHKNQQVLWKRINQLEGKVRYPVPQQETKQPSIFSAIKKKITCNSLFTRLTRRPAHGTAWGAPLIIFITVCAVLLVGLSAPQVMIGDEVTHYYMLQTQAKVLPQPNFIAEIPTGWGKTEVRRYPHSFGWHYLGAVIYKLTNGSFAAIQLYQALFLAQFLGMAYLLARSRGGVQTRAALLYLLILASLPMSLIFTVAFYQDIPMAAQVLTAFYLLRHNRWLLATLFICGALAIKVTALLFFPAFFICLLLWTVQRSRLKKTVAIFCCSLLLVFLCTWGLGRAINVYAGASFYPLEKFNQIIHFVKEKINPVSQKIEGRQLSAVKQQERQPEQRHEPRENITENQAKIISEQQASIIANHPGDLRIKANYFIYGGLLFWLLIFAGAVATALQIIQILQRSRLGRIYPAQKKNKSSYWLWGVGLSYTCIAAAFLKTAPDARFFLPGLPFLLLPIAEQTVRLPRPKWVISLLASLALLQGGYVLAKTYTLRQVSPELKAAIAYLQQAPPVSGKIFMYPEGNYRLFPVPHEWYMNYHLREFWRADNDLRLKILRRFHIRTIVVKKYLVAPVDENITNLGVYPDYFVQEIQQDDRFHTVFENNAIRIVQISDIKESSLK
ncbi:MAG: DUF2304 family protein [Candidatus Electrothrix sp. AU1_5]|nr:DUF2304 family protein [Candidatus Electrothrix gigas]